MDLYESHLWQVRTWDVNDNTLRLNSEPVFLPVKSFTWIAANRMILLTTEEVLDWSPIGN